MRFTEDTSDTINFYKDATFAGDVVVTGGLTVDGSPQAGEVRFSRSGINSSSYTMLCTVAGDNLASIIDMTITGTSNNVVLNSSFEILVNHSQDIHVKSVSGDYKEVTLRITSDNNEDFSIEAKHNGSTTTTIEVCVFPKAGETITPTSTDPNYTGTEYEHTATEGFRFGGTDGTTESSNLIVDGRIGIGTTSPASPLSVVGSARIDGSSGDGVFTIANSAGSQSLRFDQNSIRTTTNNNLTFLTNGNSNSLVLEQANNRVGVGISGPQSKFHVSGGDIRIDNNQQYLAETAGGGVIGVAKMDGSDNLLIGDGNLKIDVTGTTARLIIDSSGNTTLAGDLTVQGDISTTGTFTIIDTDVSTTEQLVVTNDGTGPAVIVNQKGVQPVVDFQDDGTSVFYIKNGGNVGIGITDPDQKLDVNGNIRIPNQGKIVFGSAGTASDYLQLYDVGTSGNLLKLVQDGNTRFTITGVSGDVYMQGAVGIGTASPTSKLYVSSGAFSSGEGEIRNDARVNRNYKLALGTTTKYIGTVQMNGNGDSSGFHVRIYDGHSKVWREVNVVVQNSGGTNNTKVIVEGGGDDVNINVEFAYVNRSGAAQKTDFYLVPTSSKSYTQLIFVDGFIERDTGHSSTSSTNINLDTAVGIYKAATDDSSKIGIGTVDPSHKLTVEGDGIKIISTATNAGSGQIRLGTTGSNSRPVWSMGPSNDEDELQIIDSGYWRLRTRNTRDLAFGVNNEDVIYIEGSNENVGINDIAPQGKLQIDAGGDVNCIHLVNSGQNSSNFATRPISIIFGDEQKGASARHQASINCVREAWSSTPAALTFKTATGVNTATERMRITSGGNVGIGTTTPSSLLNLSDASNNLSHQIGFSYVSGGTETDAFTIGRNNSTGNLEFHSDMNNHGFEFKHNAAGTQEFNILNLKVGIGTDAPETLLHVKAADTVTGVIKVEGGKNTVSAVGEINSEIQFGSNDPSVGGSNIGGKISSVTEHSNGAWVGLGFYTYHQTVSDLAEHMRLTHHGRLGLGTTEPSHPFHLIAADGDISGDWACRLTNSEATAGQNFGVKIDGGSNASDVALEVSSLAGTHLFEVRGDGNVGIGETAPSIRLYVKDSESIVGYFKSTTNKAAIAVADDDTLGYFSAESGRVTMGFNSGLHADNINILESGSNYYVGIGTVSPVGPLTLANVNGGNWNDGLIIDDPTGWAATVYKRSNSPKMFTGLYTGNDNFIWMSSGYSNSGTTITAPRADAVLMARPSTDDLQIYLETHFGNNVGIATTAPTCKLQVDEYTVGSNGNQDSGIATAAIFTNSGSDGLYLGIKNASYPNRGYAFKVTNNGVNSDFTIKEHGLSGDRFKIFTGGKIEQNYISYTDSSNYEALQITGESDHIRFTTRSIGSFASNNRNFKFYQNGNLRFEISNAGVTAYSNFYTASGGAFRAYGHDSIISTGGGDYDIKFNLNDQEKVRFKANGNVGIGVNDPSEKLDISAGNIELDTAYAIQWGGTANRIWGSGGNNYIKIETNGVERLRVDGQGDVGINETNPAEKLHVKGNARVGYSSTNGHLIGSKAYTITHNFTTGLTVSLAHHTACHVKVFITGDWGNHSSLAYVGEFIIQNAGDTGYNEPGIILTQQDNLHSDSIASKIVDPTTGGGSPNDFTIQFQAVSDTSESISGRLCYHIMGDALSVS